MAGNLGKTRSGSSYRKPPAPSRHERAEHEGRVPQVGIPSGPRQTVAPAPGSVAAKAGLTVYSPPSSRTRSRSYLEAKRRRTRAVKLAKSTPRRKTAKKTTAKAKSPVPAPQVAPKTFHGKRTAGTPNLKTLKLAERKGTLKTNKRGYLTTPPVRKVGKELKQAKAAVKRSQPSTKSLQPAEKAVVSLARKAHRQYPDIPVSVLMAQIKQESGFQPVNESSAGAEGLSQFIPSTAASYGVKYGAGRKEQQSQVTGQAHYLHDLGFGSDPKAAMSGYTGGYSDAEYNDPVLTDAKASYSNLDKPGNPKAVKRLKKVKAKAADLGLKAGVKKNKVVTVPGKGRYVFPFPQNKGWTWSRTDMGTDFGYGASTGAPIRALGSGKIVQTGAPGWPGEGGILLKLDHAKGLPSPYIFVYEGIEPTVEAGQRVKKGQLVGRGGITGSIEIGFADSSGQALAHDIYTEGMETPQGKAMTNFLHAIEKGKTRVPVKLLSVGGTLTPSSGGTVYAPDGTVEGTVPAQQGRKGRRPSLSPTQKAHRTMKKLESLGVGTPTSTSESKVASPTLKSLEAKYGVKVA